MNINWKEVTRKFMEGGRKYSGEDDSEVVVTPNGNSQQATQKDWAGRLQPLYGYLNTRPDNKEKPYTTSLRYAEEAAHSAYDDTSNYLSSEGYKQRSDKAYGPDNRPMDLQNLNRTNVIIDPDKDIYDSHVSAAGPRLNRDVVLGLDYNNPNRVNNNTEDTYTRQKASELPLADNPYGIYLHEFAHAATKQIPLQWKDRYKRGRKAPVSGLEGHDDEANEAYADFVRTKIMLMKLGIFNTFMNPKYIKKKFDKKMLDQYRKTLQGASDRFIHMYDNDDDIIDMINNYAYIENLGKDDVSYAAEGGNLFSGEELSQVGFNTKTDMSANRAYLLLQEELLRLLLQQEELQLLFVDNLANELGGYDKLDTTRLYEPMQKGWQVDNNGNVIIDGHKFKTGPLLLIEDDLLGTIVPTAYTNDGNYIVDFSNPHLNGSFRTWKKNDNGFEYAGLLNVKLLDNDEENTKLLNNLYKNSLYKTAFDGNAISDLIGEGFNAAATGMKAGLEGINVDSESTDNILKAMSMFMPSKIIGGVIGTATDALNGDFNLDRNFNPFNEYYDYINKGLATGLVRNDLEGLNNIVDLSTMAYGFAKMPTEMPFAETFEVLRNKAVNGTLKGLGKQFYDFARQSPEHYQMALKLWNGTAKALETEYKILQTIKKLPIKQAGIVAGMLYGANKMYLLYKDSLDETKTDEERNSAREAMILGILGLMNSGGKFKGNEYDGKTGEKILDIRKELGIKENENIIDTFKRKFKSLIDKPDKYVDDALGNYNLALLLYLKGVDPSKILAATGWNMTKNGKLGYEVVDPKPTTTFIKDFKNGNLDKYQTLDDIFANDNNWVNLKIAYPLLKDTKVEFENNNDCYYNEDNNSIVIGKDCTVEELKNALPHESQHGIQTIEGFPRGGNKELFNNDLYVKDKKQEIQNLENEDFQSRLSNYIMNNPEVGNAITVNDIDYLLSDEGIKDMIKYKNQLSRFENLPEEKKKKYRYVQFFLQAQLKRKLMLETEFQELLERLQNGEDVQNDININRGQLLACNRSIKICQLDARFEENKVIPKPEFPIDIKEENKDAIELAILNIYDEDLKRRELIDDINTDIDNYKTKLYNNIAGENQAYAVSARKDMSPSERRFTPFESSEPIPRDLLIEIDTDGNQMMIGENRKSQMRLSIKQGNPNMTNLDIEDTISFIEELGESIKKGGNPAIEKAATHWASKGTRFHKGDEYLINQAIALAKEKKVDPMSFDNPHLIFEKFGRKPKRKKINPDDVPLFTNKKVLPNGVTIYDVENTREGLRAVRDIIDTHWGKDALPWCLARRGNLDAANGPGNDFDIDAGGPFDLSVAKDDLEMAWTYWNTYNDVLKRIAFDKKGNLKAFNATNRGEDYPNGQWWDKLDSPSEGFLFSRLDKRGRTETYIEDENGNLRVTELTRGKKDGPLYIEYNLDGTVKLVVRKVGTTDVVTRIRPARQRFSLNRDNIKADVIITETSHNDKGSSKEERRINIQYTDDPRSKEDPFKYGIVQFRDGDKTYLHTSDGLLYLEDDVKLSTSNMNGEVGFNTQITADSGNFNLFMPLRIENGKIIKPKSREELLELIPTSVVADMRGLQLSISEQSYLNLMNAIDRKLKLIDKIVLNARKENYKYNETIRKYKRLFEKDSEPSVWRKTELPGYHIKSLLEGSKLEKQVGKNGLIAINNIKSWINKSDVSLIDKYILLKVLDNHKNDKSIDYNDLREEALLLIPLYNRKPLTKYADYGVNSLGFEDPTIGKTPDLVFLENKELLNYLGYEYTPASFINGYKPSVLKYKGNIVQKGSNEYDNLMIQLSTKGAKLNTFTFESPGYIGNKNHYQNGQPLGHSRTYTTEDEPDVLHVMESLSDWALNPGKYKPLLILNFLDGVDEREAKILLHIDECNQMINTGIAIDGHKLADYEIRLIKNDLLRSYQSQLTDLQEKRLDLINLQSPVYNRMIDTYLQRQIQENIRYAAENGLTKMRYPTPETAAKIEGYHKKTEEEIWDDIVDLTPSFNITNNKGVTESYEYVPWYNDMRSDPSEYYLENDLDTWDHLVKLSLDWDKTEDGKKYINNVKNALDNNPISFYSPEYQTILKKYADFPKQYLKLFKGAEVRTVTDNKGNTWYEVDVPLAFLDNTAEMQFKEGGVLNKIDWEKAVKQYLNGGKI